MAYDRIGIGLKDATLQFPAGWRGKKPVKPIRFYEYVYKFTAHLVKVKE
jgi:hypothetical protein